MLCCPAAAAAAACRAFLALPGLGVAAAGRFRWPLGDGSPAASPCAFSAPASALLLCPPAASSTYLTDARFAHTQLGRGCHHVDWRNLSSAAPVIYNAPALAPLLRTPRPAKAVCVHACSR